MSSFLCFLLSLKKKKIIYIYIVYLPLAGSSLLHVGYSLVVGATLLIVVVSLVAEHGL